MIQQFDPTKTPKRKPRAAKPYTVHQLKRQRQHAASLCKGASTPASWRMADRFAQAMTGCGCNALGIPEPTIVEQAIIDADHEFLRMCAPDVADDLDLLDPQLELADQLNWWIPEYAEPDW